MPTYLEKIMSMLQVIHCENMTIILALTSREKGKEIVDKYTKVFNDALDYELEEESEAKT